MNKIKAAQDIQSSNRSQETKFYKPGQMASNERSNYHRNQYQKNSSCERRDNWRRPDEQSYQRQASHDADRKYKHPDKEKIKRSRSPSPVAKLQHADTKSKTEMPKSTSPTKTEVKSDDSMAKYANKDINELGAAIIKAELLGNDVCKDFTFFCHLPIDCTVIAHQHRRLP
jgi:hypothetical protein